MCPSISNFFDEYITVEAKVGNEMKNDLKDKQDTKAYEDKINTDIENINKIENRNKVYTKQWRSI